MELVKELVIPSLKAYNVKDLTEEEQQVKNEEYRHATLNLVKCVIRTPKLKIWMDSGIIDIEKGVQ